MCAPSFPEIDFACTRCDLAATRTQVVEGAGARDAVVMFVGEAPGKNEDEGGKPFIGAAGKVLDELLARADLSRDEIYITNVVKCRPPKNRNPLAQEIEACMPYLMRQIAQIKPQLIVTLGAVAATALLGESCPMGQRHGQLAETRCGGTPTKVLTLYHPAATIYNRLLHETFVAAGDRIAAISRDRYGY